MSETLFHFKNLDLILNIIIVLSTFIAVIMYFFTGPDALGATGLQCMKYFTTQSNILLGFSSIFYLYYAFRKEYKIPNWIMLFKFVGTIAASITLFTVCLFLAPTAGFQYGFRVFLKFFKGNVFILHFSNPVIGLISFLYFEKININKKFVLLGCIPSTLYSFIYLVMVVFLHKWNDWYGFTFGGKLHYVPVVIITMFLFSFLLSKIVLFIHNKIGR